MGGAGGERSEPEGSVSVGHMHCSVQSGSRAETGDGSNYFLACSPVRVLRPALVRPFKIWPVRRTRPAKVSPQLKSSRARETSLNIRLAKSGKNSRSTQTDFGPDKFHSSSLRHPSQADW